MTSPHELGTNTGFGRDNRVQDSYLVIPTFADWKTHGILIKHKEGHT